MHVYERNPELPGGVIVRNTETGSSICPAGTEGYMADLVLVYHYDSPEIAFDYVVKHDRGERQAEAILPDPVSYGDLSFDERAELRNDLRRKRAELRKELNFWHDEILEIRHEMPLDLKVAEDLMRLVQTMSSNGQGKTAHKYVVGMKNRDPKAPRGQDTPYLKLDQNGVFSIGANGEW